MAEWEIGISILSDLMEEALPEIDGEITASRLFSIQSEVARGSERVDG